MGVSFICTTLCYVTTTTTTHQFNGLFSRTTWVSRYLKSKTSLDLNEARDDELLGWQGHQLDHMQTICTSLQTENYTNTPSLQFLQAGCSSWRPTNSVKVLKDIAKLCKYSIISCRLVSVCLLQVRVPAKRMNGSSLFFEQSFLWTTLHGVVRKFGYLEK